MNPFWEGEKDAPRDRYGNPLASGTELGRKGLLLDPPLDALPRAASVWPGDAPYAVALSHDLDDPIKGQLIYGLGLGASGLVHGVPSARREGLGRVKAWGKKVLRGEPDPYFTIAAIRGLEEAEGVRSTFFGVSILDADWEVRVSAAEEPLRSALRAAAEGGWEVGLHGSNASASDGRRLAAERERLSGAIGREVKTLRQHNLRWTGPEAWARQAAAGFTCDSSVGFNDAPGFRCGTSFPLRIPGVDLVELPHALMDTYMASGTGEALLAVVRRTGGALCLNWHERAFCEADFPGRAGAYRDLIRTARRDGAWIAPVGEIGSWWMGRT